MRILAAIVFVMLSVSMSSCSRDPETVVFDFTTGFTPANAHWPSSGPTDYYERTGRFHIIVKTASGRSIDTDVLGTHAFAYSAVRERDGSLRHLLFHFGSQCSPEEAYRMAKQIMDNWNFSVKGKADLENWHAGVKHLVGDGGLVEFTGDVNIGLRLMRDHEQRPVCALYVVIQR